MLKIMNRINGEENTIEKEIKILISESKYLGISNYFLWDEEFTQTNYYYQDKEKVLSKNNITVRVREKRNKLKLQIKYPICSDKALHVKRECSEEIDSIPYIIPNYKFLECSGLKINEVKRIGKLITLRKVYKWNEKTTICLDKNEYLKKSDHEVEIEYIDNLDPNLVNLFNSLDINFDKVINGKCSRFIEQYENRKWK